MTNIKPSMEIYIDQDQEQQYKQKYYDLEKEKHNRFRKYVSIEENLSTVKSSLKNKIKHMNSEYEDDENLENKLLSANKLLERQRQKQRDTPFQYYRKKLIDSNIKNKISLNDISESYLPSAQQSTSTNKIMTKNQRTYSLKSYLDQKFKQSNQHSSKFHFPKIGKTQNIIKIIKQQIDQNTLNKSKLSRERNKRLSKSIKNMTLDKSLDIDFNKKQLNSNKSQRAYPRRQQQQNYLFREKNEKKSIKLLNPNLNNPFQQQFSIGKSKKHKIQLMGKKLNPKQRQQNQKKWKFFLDGLRNQRSFQKPQNLLSSELIYKNSRESIQKSVYKQIIIKASTNHHF